MSELEVSIGAAGPTLAGKIAFQEKAPLDGEAEVNIQRINVQQYGGLPSSRAAEQRDELAPSYVEHGASPPLWALGGLPVTAIWLLGVLLGIQLVCEGAALGYLAWQVRTS